MEIDKAGIRLPPLGDPFDPPVVGPFVKPHKVLKVFLRADVVAGKHIYPTQASQAGLDAIEIS